MLGYNLLNVGEAEISLGKDFLTNSKIFPKLVSINIMDSSTQKPIFKEYEIIESQGLKFLVSGYFPLSASKGLIQLMTSQKLLIVDPVESIKNLLTKEKDKYDFFFLLSAANITESGAITEFVRGIDLIIGSKDSYRDNLKLPEMHPPIITAQPQGKILSVLHIANPSRGATFIETSRLNTLKSSIAGIEEQMVSIRKSYLSPALKRQYLAELARKKQSHENEFSKIKKTMTKDKYNGISSNLYPLDYSIKDDPEIAKLTAKKHHTSTR
jgi:2',3'-cyclic-nucleotide 2'-phosphodiesterase (5'-nucleotidase family)